MSGDITAGWTIEVRLDKPDNQGMRLQIWRAGFADVDEALAAVRATIGPRRGAKVTVVAPISASLLRDLGLKPREVAR